MCIRSFVQNQKGRKNSHLNNSLLLLLLKKLISQWVKCLLLLLSSFFLFIWLSSLRSFWQMHHEDFGSCIMISLPRVKISDTRIENPWIISAGIVFPLCLDYPQNSFSLIFSIPTYYDKQIFVGERNRERWCLNILGCFSLAKTTAWTSPTRIIYLQAS